MATRQTYRQEVELAATTESVREAARRMRERRVGALVVVDESRVPLGILTDRDLALRVLGEGREPSVTRVAEVMTPRPVTVSEHASLDEALALMGARARRFRRLPVVDNEGRLVGILTLDDALTRISEQLASIDRVIQGETPFVMDGLVGDEGTAAADVSGLRRARGEPE